MESGFILLPIASLASLIGLIFVIIKLNIYYRRERISNFDRKRVFITGTDTGFGRELALLLDRKGLVVYAGCYTKEGGERLRKEASNNLHILDIDVTKRETLERAKNFIEKDLPPEEGLWGLVNNAGIINSLIIDLCNVEDFKQVMEVNFFGVITTTEIFLPLIKKARGRIVNVSSMAGRSSIMVEPYACSKWALEPYSDGLRRSMKTFGVHVALLEPGFHKTNMSSISVKLDDFERSWTKQTNHFKEEYGEVFKNSMKNSIVKWVSNYPIQGHPRNVARTMAHALSSKRPKARYVCGIDAEIIVRVMPFVPDWLNDFAIRKVLKYDEILKKVN